MSIRIDNIEKRFGQFQALNPISLTVEKGELVGLLGPSGSGKTTLLRLIAGLEVADAGAIWFGAENITKKPVRERRVGFVFQNYALFRHMTVIENISFGLRMLPRRRRPSRIEIMYKSQQLLEMVQLGYLANRYPDQLSGGQRQRVALARALALEPEVLLLDEPFGALDAKVRQELRGWLRELHQELGFTCVFVTHDQEEALELSDKVVVMSAGNIEQVDTPEQLFAHPGNRFVFEFLGEHLVFNANAEQGFAVNGSARLALPEIPDGKVALYLRSHEVALEPEATSQAHLPVAVLSVSRVGGQVKVALASVGWQVDAPWLLALSHEEAAALALKQGQQLYVVPRQGHLFANEEDTPRFLRFDQPLTVAKPLAVC